MSAGSQSPNRGRLTDRRGSIVDANSDYTHDFRC